MSANAALLLWVRIKLHLLFAQRRCLVAVSAAAAAVVAVAAAVAFVVKGYNIFKVAEGLFAVFGT